MAPNANEKMFENLEVRASEKCIQLKILRLHTEPKKEGTRKRKSFRHWLYNVGNWRGRTEEEQLNETLSLTDEEQTSSLFLI
jgi:hypothetical protein